jgi:catechol 1,2-dioxygenase
VHDDGDAEGAGVGVESAVLDFAFFIEAPGYRTLTTQINFGDDPRAHDDFAFGTREGLLPVPDRSGGSPVIVFDFQLQKARSDTDQALSARPRAEA